jgi:CheY-specific phosphatase CheX
MRVELDEASMAKANAQFWEQMLDMQLEPVPNSEVFCVGAGHLMGSVSLSGMWKGRIEVRMVEGLAHAATAAMLVQPLESVSAADVLDAIREIANMIGGVLKSSLPRPCAMALPESAVATEGFCTGPCNKNTPMVAFRHAAGGLVVRVWEEECGQ